MKKHIEMIAILPFSLRTYITNIYANRRT